MLVEKIFKEIQYPNDKKEKCIIFDEYNSKVNNLLYREEPKKRFKTSLLFQLIDILVVLFVIMFGDVHVIAKLLYALPIAIFIVYDFVLLCRVKKDNYKVVKEVYKKELTQSLVLISLMYGSIYIFLTIGLFDEINTLMIMLSWGVFIILSIASFFRAVKNAPDKFLNTYLNPNNKFKPQPSWVLNITSILIVLVCILKPYLLLAALVYILIVPLTSALVYTYYSYLQYDKIQKLIEED